MNYSKLQLLISKENLSLAKAGRIGSFKSGTGFREMMKNKTMTVITLENLADYFKKPIAYFFDQESVNDLVNEPQAKYGNKVELLGRIENENDFLREQIKEKDEVIKILSGKLK